MTSGKENSNDQQYFVEYTPVSKVLQSKAPLIDKNVNSVLREADKLIAEKQVDYLDWLRADIKLLDKAFQKLTTAPDSKHANRDVFKISHSMMGLGSTFDYPLITYVLQNLCKFLDDNDQLNSQSLLIVKIHINTIKQITFEKISGSGGETGKKIMRGLVKVTEPQT